MVLPGLFSIILPYNLVLIHARNERDAGLFNVPQKSGQPFRAGRWADGPCVTRTLYFYKLPSLPKMASRSCIKDSLAHSLSCPAGMCATCPLERTSRRWYAPRIYGSETLVIDTSVIMSNGICLSHASSAPRLVIVSEEIGFLQILIHLSILFLML